MGTNNDQVESIKAGLQRTHRALVASKTMEDSEAIRLMMRAELDAVWDCLHLLAKSIDRSDV